MSVEVEPILRRRVQPKRLEVVNLKILVIGDPGVGKTSLVRRFCSKVALAAAYTPTVGADFSVRSLPHRGKDVRVNIWDASGSPEFVDVRNEFYKEMQGIVLVFDVTSKATFQNLELWITEASKYCQGNIPHVVVGTKVDSGARVVPEQLARDWAKSKGFTYTEVSAASGKNIEVCFMDLAWKLV
mmetsp:Transcript_35289/g.77098  ORF Transcript_35289/g.77098 Transcript_35289/m.77098 type:complete len:185 (+) Transcript_35289:88-642(+)